MGKHSEVAKLAASTYNDQVKELLPLIKQAALDDIMAQAIKGATETSHRPSVGGLTSALADDLASEGYIVADKNGVLLISWSDSPDVTAAAAEAIAP